MRGVQVKIHGYFLSYLCFTAGIHLALRPLCRSHCAITYCTICTDDWASNSW